MNRRMFIKAVAGGCLLGMVTGAGKLTASPQLRPPGALPETDFLAVLVVSWSFW